MTALSREVPIDPAHATFLIIDVQNYCAGPVSGKTEYFRRNLHDTVLPNIRRLQAACRRPRLCDTLHGISASARSAVSFRGC